MDKKEKVVTVSGGFDPIHVGHVRLFEEAKKLGDKLFVILNNDHWLRAKKGYVFMPQEERKEVLEAFSAVDEVVISNHPEDPDDMSVSQEVEKIRPDVHCNGGDRKKGGSFEAGDVPEDKVCEKYGIEMKFGVGGEKIQSSSRLIEELIKKVEGNEE